MGFIANICKETTLSTSRFIKKSGPFRLSELAKFSGAEAISDNASFLVYDLASLSDAQATDLSVLHQKKYINALEKSSAGACIIKPSHIEYAPQGMHLLVHNNPYKAFALISQVFYTSERKSSHIAESASVAKSAILGNQCRIEHGAYIGENVVIGDRCTIGVNTYIGDGVVMGDDCQIENNVSICCTIMGNKVVVYPGARVGQDGFGFASDQDGHYKISHSGKVLIGNDVEIGANTCIDKGSLKDTIIEDLCRIDNLVQIAHNVKIGKGTILAGQVGIAGSSELGEFVTLGGQAGVANHAKIGSKATVMVRSLVLKDVNAGARMGGYPAVSLNDWHRQTISLKKIIKKSGGQIQTKENS